MFQFPSVTESNIEAVLFDCDGVMCLPLRFAEVLRREHNITREMTFSFYKSYFVPALRGEVDVANLLPPYLKEWNWRGSTSEFLDLWLSSERDVRADMTDLVNAVKQCGYITGLATNQESRRAKYMREHMGFGSLFDHCFISSELGAMKPDREYFEKATRQLGLLPSQVAFIDDQQDYVDGAAAFGWQTILFNGSSADAARELASVLNRN